MSRTTVIGIILLCLIQGLSADQARLAGTYESKVRPLLQRYCFDCHGEQKQKSGLRMDELNPDLIQGMDAETWHDVLDQLNLGEMPPEKADQPKVSERAILVDWVTQSLEEAAAARRFTSGRVMMRRLTRYEYANTLKDLLGVDRDFSTELPPEPLSPDGFLNNAATLEMSPSQIETYLSAARKALEYAIVEGPKPTIHHYLLTNTITAKLPDKKVAGHLPVNPEFAMDVKKYPREGPFHLRLTARASIPDDVGYPRIRISLGHVPGIVHVPHKVIGEVELTSGEPQTFEFTGWMQDYPQAGDVPFGNTGITGMILFLDYLDADGNELRYPDRQYVRIPAKPKKGQKAKPRPEPPPFGSRLEIEVDALEFETPFHTSWPPPSHQRLMAGHDPGKPILKQARPLISRFLNRAFRRPVSNEEIKPYLQVFAGLHRAGKTFEESLRETFAAALVSPHFLYIVEPRSETDTAQKLTDHELAVRLSYFLWNTMPDARLSRLSKEGKLHDPKILTAEVNRLLKSPRSDAFSSTFADQWLDLGALERVAVNPEFYPEFDNALKDQMRKESIAYFREFVRRDLSCLEMLNGNWSMLNRSLAAHYGIEPLPRSDHLARTVFPPAMRRGGLLGHGSFLVSQSSGEFAHPIKRAVWILDRLLDSPPAPPPPDVPELDSESPDLKGLSVKEQLALHRDREACANCHKGIDPWGVSLEHFDAIGQWRKTLPVRLGKKNEKPPEPTLVDATTRLPDGTGITGASDLRRYLSEQKREHFARSMVKRMLSYALGRSLDFGDRKTVEKLTHEFIAHDFRLGRLIHDLVETEAFQSK